MPSVKDIADPQSTLIAHQALVRSRHTPPSKTHADEPRAASVLNQVQDESDLPITSDEIHNSCHSAAI